MSPLCFSSADSFISFFSLSSASPAPPPQTTCPARSPELTPWSSFLYSCHNWPCAHNQTHTNTYGSYAIDVPFPSRGSYSQALLQIAFPTQNVPSISGAPFPRAQGSLIVCGMDTPSRTRWFPTEHSCGFALLTVCHHE